MQASSPSSAEGASRNDDRQDLLLVSGGTGFLGSAAVRELARRGRRVAVMSRSARRVARSFPHLDVDAREGDVTRPGTLRDAVAGVRTVVHCVQFPGSPVEDPDRGRTFLEVDAAGTRAIVDAAVEAGVEKLVYVSGVGADLHSDRDWFRAKGIAEAAVSGSGLDYVIVRPSWVYGPGDASLNRFAGIIRWVPGFFPQIGSGDQRLNPVFIDDVGSLLADCARAPAAIGRVLEVGGPDVMTMDEIIEATMDVLGRRKPMLHFPIPLVKLGALLFEWLPGQLLSRDAVDFITESALADLGAVMEIFPDFEPRPFREGVAIQLGDD